MPSQPSAQACLKMLAPSPLNCSFSAMPSCGSRSNPASLRLRSSIGLPPDVLAVHLQQIEGAEHCARVGAMTTDEVEHRKPTVIADDGFTIDDARAHRECCDGFGGEREAIDEIVAIPAHQADGAALPMSKDAEAVVLDLVNPAGGRLRLFGLGRGV
jgi:hypothetical protein